MKRDKYKGGQKILIIKKNTPEEDLIIDPGHFYEDELQEPSVDIKYSYPNNPDYEYGAKLERIDLDKERVTDILTDNGFIISPSKGSSLKARIKNPNGIFSFRYGQSLSDLNPEINRYRCKCGATRNRIHRNQVCDKCGERVKEVNSNFEYFGWMILNDAYFIIHPNLYKAIEFLMGKGYGKKSKLENIIAVKDDKDMNGFSIENKNKPKDEPWYGLGMIGFQKNFDEILEYYLKKKPQKKDVYDSIMKSRNIIFSHSIPVFTTLLRPSDIRDGSMSYEKTNATYNIMYSLVNKINKDKTISDRAEKPKNDKLFQLQSKYNELYKELEDIFSGKKGQFRSLIGGRFTFSGRNVIAPDPTLRVDQVKLSYFSLIVLLEPRIENILHTTYGLQISEAKLRIERGKLNIDDGIKKIIEAIIKSTPKGLPLIINRNPTIGYGSILQVYCVGVTEHYTLSIPLQILPLVAGDFDGDIFNIILIINKAFEQRASEVFNPRNCMWISMNDGYVNIDIMHQRDTMIMMNTFINLGRDKYTPEEMEDIMRLRAKVKQKFKL